MLLRNLFFTAATAHAFVLPPAPRTTRLQMMPPKPGDMTPESMRQAADALKTLKPDQIQQMLKEVEDMSPEERERLKGMGINPDMLKMSMKVMKANPNVIKMAQEQMAKMSPEQMKQASDLAQKQMEAMAPEDLEKMADSAIAGAGGPVVDVDVDEDAPARNARDEALVDALFVVAAAMSKQPGAVTLEAFKQLPPIQSLRGELPDDLSDAEIADAWAAVSTFATPSTRRITGSFPHRWAEAGLAVGAAADKTAFTRAWLALDQLYDDDMMVEARRPPKKTRAPDV